MKIKVNKEVDRELKKIKKRDQKLINKIEKQLSLFSENPKHPSLRTHKLSGKSPEMWSISVTMDLRMIYLLEDDTHALFVKIGTHDQVYKKK